LLRDASLNMQLQQTTNQILRYIANGVVATLAHYIVLYHSIEVYGLSSAGLANFWASLVGIGFSFLGNRFIVFNSTHQKAVGQFSKFVMLYFVMAVLHGGLLYVWSDIWNYDYNYGFAFAVMIQFFLGYAANRHIVFKKSPHAIGEQVKI
jgi:putative flippase GtrA